MNRGGRVGGGPQFVHLLSPTSLSCPITKINARVFLSVLNTGGEKKTVFLCGDLSKLGMANLRDARIIRAGWATKVPSFITGNKCEFESAHSCTRLHWWERWSHNFSHVRCQTLEFTKPGMPLY